MTLETVSPEIDPYHTDSVEYKVALEDLTRLKPQYEEAVARYKAARDKMAAHLAAGETNTNLI